MQPHMHIGTQTYDQFRHHWHTDALAYIKAKKTWATAASADLFRSSRVARRSSPVARLEIPLCLLTYLTLPYLPYLTYLTLPYDTILTLQVHFPIVELKQVR